MGDIPAYVSRERLCRELDICERTLDRYLTLGFPQPKRRPGREPRFKWTEVEQWMDSDGSVKVASEGNVTLLERVRHASRQFNV